MVVLSRSTYTSADVFDELGGWRRTVCVNVNMDALTDDESSAFGVLAMGFHDASVITVQSERPSSLVTCSWDQRALATLDKLIKTDYSHRVDFSMCL